VLPAATPAHPPVWEPAVPVRSISLDSREERVRLALRIVVHLDQLGPPGPDGTARPESTQEGVALALSVTQGAVSKVLRRLVVADAVGQERRHVPGRDRRVWAYHLLPRGQAIARQIEERFGVSPSPFPRPQS